jgi:hypothetical protein
MQERWPRAVACSNSASGDDEPSNSHSVLNPRRPDGGRFCGRYAHLMQTGAWAGLQVLSRRQTAGSVAAVQWPDRNCEWPVRQYRLLLF